MQEMPAMPSGKQRRCRENAAEKLVEIGACTVSCLHLQPAGLHDSAHDSDTHLPCKVCVQNLGHAAAMCPGCQA